MRTDKKIKRYIEKTDSNIVKNYKEMCKILREEEKTKTEKELQFEEWKCYFDFEIQGQKFIIKKVYTELMIKSNEKIYAKKQKERETENSINRIMIRKEYREFLFPILFCLLKEKTENTILCAKVDLAEKCGFFNANIHGKSKIKNYIDYKEIQKSRFPDKKYWEFDMIESNYFYYLQYIKAGVFGIVERALNALQEVNVLNFSEVKVGIKLNRKIKTVNELSSEDKEKYKKLYKDALNEILLEYNKKTKRKRRSIKEKDLIPYPGLLQKYYQKLNSLVSSNLKYDSVADYYKVEIIDLNSKILEELDTIKSNKELKEFQRKLNDRYSDNLQSNAWKHYKNKCEQEENSDEVEKSEETERKAKTEYYNRIEIIDQLVSLESVYDVKTE